MVVPTLRRVLRRPALAKQLGHLSSFSSADNSSPSQASSAKGNSKQQASPQKKTRATSHHLAKLYQILANLLLSASTSNCFSNGVLLPNHSSNLPSCCATASAVSNVVRSFFQDTGGYSTVLAMMEEVSVGVRGRRKEGGFQRL